MLIYVGGGRVPDDADYRLVVRGCKWDLTRDEFDHLEDVLAPITDASCDEIERLLREIREDR